MNESGQDRGEDIVEIDEFFDIKREVLLSEHESDVEIIDESEDDSVAQASAQSPLVVNVTDGSTLSDDDVPHCWTKTQCENFRMHHKWLVIKNRKLGCRPCMRMFQIELAKADDNADLTKGLGKSAIGWRTCQIVSNAQRNTTHQAALRGRISVHERSTYHMTAIAAEEQLERFAVQERLIKFKNQLDPKSLLTVFTLAYNVVKCQQPFDRFSSMCSFDGSENFFNATSLTREKLFCSILNHIATELRKSLVKRMLSRTDQKISIVMHETRFTNGGKMLIGVHLKFHDVQIFDKQRPNDAYVFFDLLSASSRNSEEAIVALIHSLLKYNVTKEFLRTNVLSFILDEYSTLFGLNSSIAKTLGRQVLLFPRVKINYGFDHAFKESIRKSFDNIRKTIKCALMFTTPGIADTMFISLVGPTVENFRASDIVPNWLTNGDPQNTQMKPPSPKKKAIVDEEAEKISIDMALAAEPHDEQRLVIDLRSESNSNSHQGSDDIVEDAPTITVSSYCEENTGDNGECNVKRKKRSWRQVDTSTTQNSVSADNDTVEKVTQRFPQPQVRSTSDSCATCNEDNDRLFLLSLLPFMKQMNTRANLEFRTEVQQLLQKKITSK
ncbi:uncharacterized protein LOC135848743 [Planococcus citri]|uniref:uncharacterized protein LOC135848743 n=1 Tax=Planococcus citri TaxID=170843 RepID=UPI0031F8DF79